MHTHSRILNVCFLCTHYMQQHRYNVVQSCIIIYSIRRVYMYMHTYHTYVSDVLFFSFLFLKILRPSVKIVKLSINNHIVGLLHKHHAIKEI